jgi:hypothetical protein
MRAQRFLFVFGLSFVKIAVKIAKNIVRLGLGGKNGNRQRALDITLKNNLQIRRVSVRVWQQGKKY